MRRGHACLVNYLHLPNSSLSAGHKEACPPPAATVTFTTPARTWVCYDHRQPAARGAGVQQLPHGVQAHGLRAAAVAVGAQSLGAVRQHKVGLRCAAYAALC